MREFLLVLHFIGMSMGLGYGFVMMALNIASKNWEESEKRSVMLKALNISIVGKIGLLLLIASGIALVIMYNPHAFKNGLFHLKMSLVVIMTILIGWQHILVKKLNKGDNPAAIKKISMIGPALHLLTLGVVISAVVIFK